MRLDQLFVIIMLLYVFIFLECFWCYLNLILNLVFLCLISRFALLEMFEIFNWKRVGLFIEDSSNLEGYHNFFKEFLGSRNINVAFDSKVPSITDLQTLSDVSIYGFYEESLLFYLSHFTLYFLRVWIN